jgi:hypothetical protein
MGISLKLIVLVFALGLMVISATTKASLTDGLISYWNFNNCSGINIADNVGSENGKIINDNYNYVTGKFGCGLELNNNCDVTDCFSYVNLFSNTSIPFYSPQTLSLWINTSSWTDNSYQFSKAGFNDDCTGQLCGYMTFWGSGTIKYVLFNGVDGFPASSTTEPLNNKWYLFTFVKSIIPARIYIYINGTLEDDVAYTNNGFTEFPDGGLLLGTDWSNSVFFSGLVDDVRLYNRVLSGSEIMDLYNFNPSEIIDNKPPQIFIHSPLNTTYYNDSVLLNYTVIDDLSENISIFYYLNNVLYSNSTIPNNTQIIDTLNLLNYSSQYNFSLVAMDLSNNTNQTDLLFNTSIIPVLPPIILTNFIEVKKSCFDSNNLMINITNVIGNYSISNITLNYCNNGCSSDLNGCIPPKYIIILIVVGILIILIFIARILYKVVNQW